MAFPDLRKDFLSHFCNSKLQKDNLVCDLWFDQEGITLNGPYEPGENPRRTREKEIDLDDVDPIPTCLKLVLKASDSYVPSAEDLGKIHRVFPNVKTVRIEFSVDDFSFLRDCESLYYLTVISSKQSHLKGIEFVHQITHLCLSDAHEDDYPARVDPWNLSNLDHCRLLILAINTNQFCKFVGRGVVLPTLRELILSETCYRACKVVDIPQRCEINMRYNGSTKRQISDAIVRWKPENEFYAGNSSQH